MKTIRLFYLIPLLLIPVTGCGGGGGGAAPPQAVQENLVTVQGRVALPSGRKAGAVDVIQVFFTDKLGRVSDPVDTGADGAFSLQVPETSDGVLTAKKGDAVLKAPLVVSQNVIINPESTLAVHLMSVAGLGKEEALKTAAIAALDDESSLLAETSAAWDQGRAAKAPAGGDVTGVLALAGETRKTCQSQGAWCVVVEAPKGGNASNVYLVRQESGKGFAVGGGSFQLEVASGVTLLSATSGSGDVRGLIHAAPQSALAQAVFFIRPKAGASSTIKLFRIQWTGQAAGGVPARAREVKLRGPLGEAQPKS